MRPLFRTILTFHFGAIGAALLCAGVSAQESTSRDARSVLEACATAMGGTAPADSEILGSVEITLGGTEESGSIRVITRGVDQTQEEIVAPTNTRTVSSSGLDARVAKGGDTIRIKPTMAVTAQSPNFPLVFIRSILDNPDSRYEYVREEIVNGENTHHVRTWNTFSSNPARADLGQFTIKDLWVSAQTSLLVRLAYERATGAGWAARVPVEVSYGDYRTVNGTRCPFRIEKTYNGTPWQVVHVDQVHLGIGLTDQDFLAE